MTKAAKQPRETKVPFFRSIQAKYALTYLLVVAAILIVMNTYPLLMVENMVFASKESTLKQQALVIGSALAVSETLTREGVEQTMAVLEKGQGTRVLVADGTGRILYDSSTLDNRLGDYALMGEVVAALRGKDVARSEYREGAIRCRAAVPVLYHGATLGAVYLYEYDAEQAQVLLSIQSNLRYISLVIGVAAMLLVLLFSKALTRNTGRLLSAIRRVREGEYSHRVDSRGRDEMAQLADEFNQLTDRLQTTEEARRRFVSDASHELKTPLTVLLADADILLAHGEDTVESQRKWVEAIREEGLRMKGLVQDLLYLARGDAGQRAAARETVSLSDAVERCVLAFEPVAFEAGLTLDSDTAPNLSVTGDGEELRRLCAILLDNACKYGQQGGQITVTLKGGERAVLTVHNTGEPIPPEAQAHLFERFYRADAARSRETGGYGLGLSIAAAIVEGHRGKITVHSAPGEGTAFTVTLPMG